MASVFRPRDNYRVVIHGLLRSICVCDVCSKVAVSGYITLNTQITASYPNNSNRVNYKRSIPLA